MTSGFEEYLDQMKETLGLSSRIEVASEICRWHNTFSKTTVELAAKYLQDNPSEEK